MQPPERRRPSSRVPQRRRRPRRRSARPPLLRHDAHPRSAWRRRPGSMRPRLKPKRVVPATRWCGSTSTARFITTVAARPTATPRAARTCANATRLVRVIARRATRSIPEPIAGVSVALRLKRRATRPPACGRRRAARCDADARRLATLKPFCWIASLSGREARMIPFFVQIKCHLGKSYDVANRIADAEIASEIYSTAGDFDLLVKFYVDAGTDIGHFINEKVQTIPGIQDTRTILTFKAFGR